MRIDVWFVMLPGVLSLDMTGPAETFVLAGDAFRLHYIGPQPDVPTSIGLTMSGIQPLPESLSPGSLLVLPGVSDSRFQFSTPQAQQIQHWLMRRQPQLVLVSIGGNDFLRKVPEADTRSNIRQIVQQIKAAGVPAVLVAVPYFTTGALFGRLSEHPMYEELAAELNVPLLKGAWAEVLGDKKLKSDQIHANAQGYRVFAEKMWAFLKQQGFAR